MKYYYPAIFHVAEDGISVSFPDVPECLMVGYTIDEAINMAEEVLTFYLEDRMEEGKPLSAPRDIREIEAPEHGFTSYVKVTLPAA